MRLIPGLLFLSAFSMAGCSSLVEKSGEVYRFQGREGLQKLSHWYLEGRLAMADERDSFSASLSWRHSQERDDIELAGPLSQGKLLITVQAEIVSVDDGEIRKQFRGPVEDVLAEQLGVMMPVNALKYWVLGVPDPGQAYIEQDDGFSQIGWSVGFKEMQSVNASSLPRKINAEKDKTRVKLVVDQWDLT